MSTKQDPKAIWESLTAARRRRLCSLVSGDWIFPYGGVEHRMADALVSVGLAKWYTGYDTRLYATDLGRAVAAEVGRGNV